MPAENIIRATVTTANIISVTGINFSYRTESLGICVFWRKSSRLDCFVFSSKNYSGD